MTHDAYAKAFNKWMDDFVNDPDKFESTTSTALRHLRERNDGQDPSYGEVCATVLAEYLAA